MFSAGGKTYAALNLSPLRRLLAFGLGVLADSAWASLFATSSADEQIPPVLIQRDNELHRLYEAVTMTGDADILGTIQKRLLCMGDDGLLDALEVERDNGMWCIRADGTEYRFKDHV